MNRPARQTQEQIFFDLIADDHPTLGENDLLVLGISRVRDQDAPQGAVAAARFPHIDDQSIKAVVKHLFPNLEDQVSWVVELRADGKYGPDLVLYTDSTRAPYPAYADQATLGVAAMTESTDCEISGMATKKVIE